MEEVKSMLSSKTIWGALIAVVGALLGAFGLEASSLTGMDSEIVTFVGSALAIYGRIAAVKKIG